MSKRKTKPKDRTQPEHLRKNGQVLLRLSPEVVATLDEIAKRQGRDRSATISALVMFGAFHGWSMIGCGRSATFLSGNSRSKK